MLASIASPRSLVIGRGVCVPGVPRGDNGCLGITEPPILYIGRADVEREPPGGVISSEARVDVRGRRITRGPIRNGLLCSSEFPGVVIVRESVLGK